MDEAPQPANTLPIKHMFDKPKAGAMIRTHRNPLRAAVILVTLSAPMSPLRYAILRHHGIPDPHFDLMFELTPGARLATWRSPVWPITLQVTVTQLPDHRPLYLTYEGPVSD